MTQQYIDAISHPLGPDILMILSDTCSYFKQPVDRVNSKDRHREYVTVRQAAQYIAKQVLGKKASLTMIGAIIGGVDHCTVMSSIKQIEGQILPVKNDQALDPDLRRAISICLWRMKIMVEGKKFLSMGTMISNLN